MSVEIFSQGQFESALPAGFWTALGLQHGEFCYLVRPYPSKPLGIYVRSSVGPSGVSADAGEDSIRVYIINTTTDKPAGNKAQAWVTRMKGWQKRLTELLRKLTNQIRWTGPCVCGQGSRVPFITKQGLNKGRGFVTCEHRTCRRGFYWTEDEDGKFLTPLPELKNFKLAPSAPPNTSPPHPYYAPKSQPYQRSHQPPYRRFDDDSPFN